MSATPQLTSICREFLGWDRPALPEAARRLVERYRQAGVLDLARVIVVVPGQRAGRRLQELLCFVAEDEKLRLTPPEVITEGQLPEMLYTPKLPFATDLVQDLAWARVLQALPADEQRHLLPHPPAAEDAMRWLALAKVLRRLHRELAADGLDFAAVLKKGPKLADFGETKRWQTLVIAQRRYHDLLDAQKLWDIQTARLKAVEFLEIATERDIILLGTVDLNDTLRQMLDQVAEHVTAYIIAPESLADRFDAHGCLAVRTWCEAEIPLKDEQLRQVEGPAEQADAVTDWLAEQAGRYRNDEIAIGVPDNALVLQLQRQFQQCGVKSRWVEGARLGETGPFRLLDAAVVFAGQRRYDDLAALVRHPDLENWLRPSGASGLSLPAQLDRFYNAHLPSRMPSARSLYDSAQWPNLAWALTKIEAWLEAASTKKPLRQWGAVLRTMLSAVYGKRVLQLDDPADEVLHRTTLRIVDATNQLDALPESMDTVSLTAADAFQVALGPLGDEALAPPADPEAIELLGWLELPLDDSRALVVTSFNEGFVPQSTGADAFLPDRLRRELGLLHNERRFARDAYATCVLYHGREEMRVIFARRDTKRDPLQPSRLLFACPDKTMIRRAQQFFGERKAPAAPRRLLLAPDAPVLPRSLFEVPRPENREGKLERISVTRFKSYLACPYRYYLRHVRKLEVVDDTARELDGSAFGMLLHSALSELGRDTDGPRHSTRAAEVFGYLEARLEAFAEEHFGAASRRASIRLQLELARQRLQAFARAQAALAAEGWRIVHAEDAENNGEGLSVSFTAQGQAIDLIGRIDRIDRHEKSGVLRILDYKSADEAKKPDQTHRKGEEWIDLQLPLYRHLWRGLQLDVPADAKVELGYFNLPKRLDQTAVALGEWDDAILQDADETAVRVICNLREGVFWPPIYPAPKYSEDLSAICLDNAQCGPRLDEDTEGGAA